MANNHWTVESFTDTRGEVTIYERVDYTPSPKSTRVLAEEIDCKPKSRAVEILKTMFESVFAPEGSNLIYCRRAVKSE